MIQAAEMLMAPCIMVVTCTAAAKLPELLEKFDDIYDEGRYEQVRQVTNPLLRFFLVCFEHLVYFIVIYTMKIRISYLFSIYYLVRRGKEKQNNLPYILF